MVSKSMENLVKNSSTIRQMFEEGNNLIKKYGKENVFDFSIGNPSVNPPKELNSSIKEIVDNTDSKELHGYMSNAGYEDVRINVANYLNNEFNTSFNKQNIIMCCGAAAGLNIILKSILNPDDEVIIFKPYFMEYRNYISNYNGKIVEIEALEDFTPNLEDLKNKINEKTKAIIINNPNNPSGVLYSEDIIKSLSNVLYKAQEKYNHDIFLISDEPYREIVFDGKKAPFIPKYYNNSFIVYSYSKSLSIPGERIGYVIVPDEINDKENIFNAISIANRILGFINAPSLMQKVLSKLLGKTSDLSEYEKNRDLLYNGLTDLGYTCIKPQGTFYLFLKSPVKDEKEFIEKAKKFNILMVPGSSFACPGYVRIAFCVEYEMIKRALPKFKELAKEFNLGV